METLKAIEAKSTCRGESPVWAVMNCTVPRSEEAPAFYEAARHRVWRRTAGGWTTEAPEGTERDSLKLTRLFLN